jgi:excisionase family DNA binding protein
MGPTTRLLTTREVADLVAVSPETILRWTRRGAVPAIRLPGGAIRYRPEAVDSWLDARATAVVAGVASGTSTEEESHAG